MVHKSPFSSTAIPLRLVDVTIRRDENEILRHINLEVYAGSLVYIMGPVGCGKSSLLELVYGELPHTEGEAEVLGYNLSKLKIRQRQAMRRHMGIVFQSQDQLLYDRNVEENLDFVLRSIGIKDSLERKRRIEEVLQKVDMQGKGYRMPHELSGGEAERICIARALIVNPSLIVLDEPTTGLDAETALSIGRLIQSIVESGTAVLMSTHNEDLVSNYPSETYRVDPSTRTLNRVDSTAVEHNDNIQEAVAIDDNLISSL